MSAKPEKYPRTPYWTKSPSVADDGRLHPNPEHFIGTPIVVTEKLDGGNTLLCDGEVYARSIDGPSVECAGLLQQGTSVSQTGGDIHARRRVFLDDKIIIAGVCFTFRWCITSGCSSSPSSEADAATPDPRDRAVP